MEALPFALVLLAASIVGCASNGAKTSADNVIDIQEGSTTRAELVQRLGEPTTVTLDGSGKATATWTYNHAVVTAWRYKVKPETLVVLFGTNNVVEQFTLVGPLQQTNAPVAAP